MDKDIKKYIIDTLKPTLFGTPVLFVIGFLINGNIYGGIILASVLWGLFFACLLVVIISTPIITGLVEKDIEDNKNGYYWTPFGKKKI